MRVLCQLSFVLCLFASGLQAFAPGNFVLFRFADPLPEQSRWLQQALVVLADQAVHTRQGEAAVLPELQEPLLNLGDDPMGFLRSEDMDNLMLEPAQVPFFLLDDN